MPPKKAPSSSQENALEDRKKAVEAPVPSQPSLRQEPKRETATSKKRRAQASAER